MDWYRPVVYTLCDRRYISAAAKLKPAAKRPRLIVSTREGSKLRGKGGIPVLCWSSATGNVLAEVDDVPQTCAEGWGASLTEHKREQSGLPDPGTGEGETIPSTAEVLVEIGRWSPICPTESRTRSTPPPPGPGRETHRREVDGSPWWQRGPLGTDRTLRSPMQTSLSPETTLSRQALSGSPDPQGHSGRRRGAWG